MSHSLRSSYFFVSSKLVYEGPGQLLPISVLCIKSGSSIYFFWQDLYFIPQLWSVVLKAFMIACLHLICKSASPQFIAFGSTCSVLIGMYYSLGSLVLIEARTSSRNLFSKASYKERLAQVWKITPISFHWNLPTRTLVVLCCLLLFNISKGVQKYIQLHLPFCFH